MTSVNPNLKCNAHCSGLSVSSLLRLVALLPLSLSLLGCAPQLEYFGSSHIESKNAMLLLQLLSLCVATTCAFPSFFHGGATTFDGSPTESVRCPHFAEKREINVKKRLPFDAKSQHISTTGSHAFVAPNFAAGDQRGPCPGLNALANHGYLPHSGYAPSATMIKAVNSGNRIFPYLIIIMLTSG